MDPNDGCLLHSCDWCTAATRLPIKGAGSWMQKCRSEPFSYNTLPWIDSTLFPKWKTFANMLPVCSNRHFNFFFYSWRAQRQIFSACKKASRERMENGAFFSWIRIEKLEKKRRRDTLHPIPGLLSWLYSLLNLVPVLNLGKSFPKNVFQLN